MYTSEQEAKERSLALLLHQVGFNDVIFVLAYPAWENSFEKNLRVNLRTKNIVEVEEAGIKRSVTTREYLVDVMLAWYITEYGELCMYQQISGQEFDIYIGRDHDSYPADVRTPALVALEGVGGAPPATEHWALWSVKEEQGLFVVHSAIYDPNPANPKKERRSTQEDAQKQKEPEPYYTVKALRRVFRLL